MSASSKKSGPSNSDKPDALGVTRLPAVLLGHVAAILCDASSLAALESVCKVWRDKAFVERLELAWKAAYLCQFEPESATDSCIAGSSKPDQTRWKTRFQRRLGVEANWMSHKFTLRKFRLDDDACFELISTLSLVLCAERSGRLLVLRLPELKAVRCWRVPGGVSALLAARDAVQFVRLPAGRAAVRGR